MKMAGFSQEQTPQSSLLFNKLKREPPTPLQTSETAMGSEPDPEPNSTPKLSLFSLPSQLSEPRGTLTPPLRSQASVPFRWEEEPGKPRTYTTILPKPSSAKCLELPPRLLTDVKITNMASPTTVLDGPFVGRSASYSATLLRRDRQRSVNILDGGGQIGAMVHSKRGYNDGSWRWMGLKDNKDVGEGSFVISSDSSSRFGSGEGEECGGVGKVKVRFRSENLSLSNTRSHFWASIYGTIKQVVPWSRKTKKSGFHK